MRERRVECPLRPSSFLINALPSFSLQIDIEHSTGFCKRKEVLFKKKELKFIMMMSRTRNCERQFPSLCGRYREEEEELGESMTALCGE